MRILFLFLAASGGLGGASWGQGSAADYRRAQEMRSAAENKVFRTEVQPNWAPDGQHFWYRVETGPSAHELVSVDAGSGERRVVLDAAQLPEAGALKSSSLRQRFRPTRRTGAAGSLRLVNRMAAEVEVCWISPEGEARSYGRLAPGAEWTQATYAGHQWVVRDLSGQVLAALLAKEGEFRVEVDGPGQEGGGGDDRGERRSPQGPVSPDGRHRVEWREHNLYVRSEGAAEAVALTQDGTAELGYRGEVAWSPDSGALVATRVGRGQEHAVWMVESSPAGQVQPKLFTHDYLKPGDRLPRPQPVMIELETKRAVAIGPELTPEFFTHDGQLEYRWQGDSQSFTFAYNQRGHQVFRLIAVDRASGAARAVVEEKSATFIDYNEKTWHRFLDETGEVVWMSERDGWCHLYLYDFATGAVKSQVTRGAWVVRRVESVDVEARQIWFYASGQRAGEDPYHLHLCRVNFDGSGMVRLTEGDGNHRVTFSPDRRWFLDRWSRADAAPVTELRRSGDGGLVCELERADWSALLATGWKVPERFAAVGRDGETAIYGTIIKPSHFEEGKSYPILEEVYAGPQDSFAAKEFGLSPRQHGLAELGFIVVQADGMGTNNRGKKFHEVCWKNLADAGFADRIGWIKAAAGTRPWMDLKRVGIYGGSAGGQNAMRALIDHGDFYRAAAADCGCHDNRMDKIWWNEQWMGWPVDESYERSSNVVHAKRMQGKLLLSVGEMDSNVDPASTMQVVDALVKADKDFELLVVPGSNHGAGEGAYGARRRMDFFVRHLMGREPRWEP